MADFHHNVFYYYHGAHRSEHERERQLENNTTKALVNTLEHCSDGVAIGFLSWLGITTVERGLVELQRPTVEMARPPDGPRSLLLGLVPRGMERGCDELLTGAANQPGDARPDAWIRGSDFVVLIESKVLSPLDPGQFQRHQRKLASMAGTPPRCLVQTWADVYTCFASMLPSADLTNTDRWLIRQFLQYLAWTGLGPFVGFSSGMFDYFVNRDDEDARQWVRGTMSSLGEELLPRLRALDTFYEDYDVGVLRRVDPHCWVAFGPGKNAYRHFAHLTVALGKEYLSIFVNVELASAIRLLRERVISDSAAFQATLCGIPEPFYLEVQERKWTTRGPLYEYHSVASLAASDLCHPGASSTSLNQLERLLEQSWKPALRVYPYFTVTKRLARESVLALSRHDQTGELIDQVASVARELHPLVSFINNGPKQ
jgi:hypothetical protein